MQQTDNQPDSNIKDGEAEVEDYKIRNETKKAGIAYQLGDICQVQALQNAEDDEQDCSGNPTNCQPDEENGYDSNAIAPYACIPPFRGIQVRLIYLNKFFVFQVGSPKLLSFVNIFHTKYTRISSFWWILLPRRYS